MQKHQVIPANLIRNIQHRLILIGCFILGLTSYSRAQMSISGPTCATIGQSYTYSVSDSYTSGYPTQWQISGGVITGTSNTSQNGTSLSSISVTWSSSTATIGVHVYSSSGPSATLNVSGTAALVAGTISSNASQTVYNTVPGTINCSAATYGGCAPVTYSYQWRKSTDQSTWADIAGATGQNLSFSSVLTQTTYYQRYVVSNSYQSGVSNTAVVNVLPPLSGGTATPASQSVFSGSAPGTISVSTIALGGNCGGSYTYQWTVSSNGSSFNLISGATGSSYTPPALTQTMYYQLRVTCGSETATSTSAVVNVSPHLASGTISSSGTTINYGTAPGTISTTVATGGACSGSYSYQWQQSTDGNVSFTDISGATGTSYTPGTLTATRGYRCKVTCSSETVYTGIYTATVYPLLVSGTISSSPSGTVNYNTPVTLTGTAATGGSGSYTYQWQSSTGGAYTNITGATALTYGPVNLTATTSYQLIVNSNGVPKTSNSVTVTVYPQLVAGAVIPASQALNYNVPSATLTGAAATGGSGTYTYQWKSATASGGPYTAISGATGLSYTPGTLAVTTYYQLVVTSNGATATSNTATVTMYPQLTAGTISPAPQTINYNTAPLALGATAGGGNGVYTYQWQNSPGTGGTFSDISGAVSASYAPPALTSTTSYQRKVTSNGVTVSTATATITVYPQLVSGNITPSSIFINYGTGTALTGVAATGGNGSYTYQWQSAPGTGTSFTNISGATGVSYSPAGLTSTTSFRRVSTSNGVSVNSNTAVVNVYGQLVAGAISPATQTVLPNVQPLGLSAPASTGGNNVYAYQWQSSATGTGSWINISGQTGLSYTPPMLSATTYYRLVTTSNGVTVNSNVSAIIVTDCYQLGTLPSADQNYILTSMPREAGITNPEDPTNTACKVMQTVQYFDGLGRPLQTVQVKASPQQNDMVQPFAYDNMGREVNKYLSYTLTTPAVSDGSYKVNALQAGYGVSAFYNPADITKLSSGVANITVPYAVNTFEASDVSRPLELGSPGTVWQPNTSNPDLGHTTRISYAANDNTAIGTVASTFKVMLYKAAIAADGTRSLINAGAVSYATGTLSVNIVKDENWQAADARAGTVQSFKDKNGETVLKRAFNRKPDASIEMLSTYYVYDNLGLLCFVLTPGANPDGGTVSQNILDNLCYQYRYDGRNRLIEKKLPGRNKDFIVYNKLDQSIMVQDGNQRSSNDQQWTVTKYDALSRQVVSGLYTQSGSLANIEYRTDMQTAVDNAVDNNTNTNLWETKVSTGNGYNTSSGVYLAYPTTLGTTLSVTYYDSYNIPGLPALYDKHLEAGMSTMTQGLVTGSLVKILDGTTGSTNMLWAANYYDDLGQNIRNFKQHYQGGGTPNAAFFNEIVTGYNNITGLVTGIVRKHYNSISGTATPAVTLSNTYLYDHIGRKIKTKEKINSDAEVILDQLDYNEIGQLTNKHLGNESGTFLQDLPYTYNERGWLSKVGTGSNIFSFTLQYNTPGAGITPQFNGNITQMLYTGQNSGSKSFGYTYDRLNRLTVSASSSGLLDESMVYDGMGNIKKLTRTGTQEGAVMTYSNLNTENSNQLGTVTNGSGATIRSYTYDPNGNATSDGMNRGITYNLMNLPSKVTQPSSTTTLATYTYSASGEKLRNMGSDGYWDYDNGIVYFGTTAINGTISYITTETGLAKPNGGTSYKYKYDIKDHLGNVHATIQRNPTTGVAEEIQEDEYYAFGLRSSLFDNSNSNRYLYNGKEIQTDLYKQYDYGARFYDPVIAKWSTPDPLSEKMRAFSNYNYGFNCPTRFRDPDGDGPTDWVRYGNKVHWDPKVHSTEEARKFYGKNATDIGTTNHYSGSNGRTVHLYDNGHWDDIPTTAELLSEDRAVVQPVEGGDENRGENKELDETLEKVDGINTGAAVVNSVHNGGIAGAMKSAKVTEETLEESKEFGSGFKGLKKITRVGGLVTTGIDAALSLKKAWDKPTPGSITKAAFKTIIFVSEIGEYTNPAVGIALSIMDATGLTDKIYDAIGKEIDHDYKHFYPGSAGPADGRDHRGSTFHDDTMTF